MKTILQCAFISSTIALVACGGGSSDDTPSNQAPDVVLAETAITIEKGQSVTLDASASSDPDADTLTYSWAGDVALEDAATVTVEDLAEGEYTFTVTVSDGELTSTGSVVVTVEGYPVYLVENVSTGSVAEPMFAYYDLDTNTQLVLTEEEAEANGEWDIAFRRTKVYVNANATTPVGVYFTENTGEFYADGAPVVERFVNATADTEAEAWQNIEISITESTEFFTDETEAAISGWYNYNFMTHEVTAADDVYFIVDSDGAMTKFNVSALTQDGFGMAAVTLSAAYQASGESVFAEAVDIALDSTDCVAPIYVDFDTQAQVDESAEWDLSIPCADGLMSFEMAIAEDAQAVNDPAYTDVDGIAAESAPYYPWLPNTETIFAFAEYGAPESNYGWAEYGINGGHKMWPNFAIYVVETGTAYYKLQILSYYDSVSAASGAFTFRFQKVDAE